MGLENLSDITQERITGRMLEKADICFKINKKVSEEEITCFNEKTVHAA